jgi:hypothetical protein
MALEASGHARGHDIFWLKSLPYADDEMQRLRQLSTKYTREAEDWKENMQPSGKIASKSPLP